MTIKNQKSQPTLGSAPLAGQKYMLNHCRFGRATVRVLRVDDTWADCEVLSGIMRGRGLGAVWGQGDTKTVRIKHGTWTLVPNDNATPRNSTP